MRILDRFKATFEHKSDKPHEQKESKNPKWKGNADLITFPVKVTHHYDTI